MHWVKPDNIVAYCKHHRRVMTPTMIKGKECLERNCWHLQKRNKQYWLAKEVNYLVRKIGKKRSNGKEALSLSVRLICVKKELKSIQKHKEVLCER